MKIPLPELGLDCEKKELKDCPFCGHEANNFMASGAPVWCANSHCGLNNGVMTKELWNTRTAENAKSVLVIDENNFAQEISNVIFPNSTTLWKVLPEEAKRTFKDYAKHLSQNAASFMRIEKGE